MLEEDQNKEKKTIASNPGFQKSELIEKIQALRAKNSEVKQLIEEKNRGLSQARNAVSKLREKLYTKEMNALSSSSKEILVSSAPGNVINLLQKKIKETKETLNELKSKTLQEKLQKSLESQKDFKIAFSTLTKVYELIEENKFLERLSKSSSLPSTINTNNLVLTQLHVRELELEKEKMLCLHDDLADETFQLKETISNLQKAFASLFN